MIKLSQVVIATEFRDYRAEKPLSVMLTDPPYSAHVHASAVSQSKRGGARKRELGFDHLTPLDRALIGEAAASVDRWSVVFSDVEGSSSLRSSAIECGAEYVRTLPWVRWSMPQLSGDRPPTGLEQLVVFWGKQRGKKAWNGPGNLTHLANKCLRGDGKHKAEKPLDLCLDLVSWFSLPGETVFDPFAGAGTIGVACKLLGRSYVGLERDQKWATHANARIAKPFSPRDLERLNQWLLNDLEPKAQGKGPTVLRAKARAADKAYVRELFEKMRAA